MTNPSSQKQNTLIGQLLALLQFVLGWIRRERGSRPLQGTRKSGWHQVVRYERRLVSPLLLGLDDRWGWMQVCPAPARSEGGKMGRRCETLAEASPPGWSLPGATH